MKRTSFYISQRIFITSPDDWSTKELTKFAEAVAFGDPDYSAGRCDFKDLDFKVETYDVQIGSEFKSKTIHFLHEDEEYPACSDNPFLNFITTNDKSKVTCNRCKKTKMFKEFKAK